MNFRKKGYIARVIILVCSLLLIIHFNGSKDIKASKENYKLEVLPKKRTDSIPILLTVDNSINEEITLSYKGIDYLENDQIKQGVSESFDGEVTVSDGRTNQEKIITIKKGSEPLEIVFSVIPESIQQSGRIRLLDSSEQELAQLEVSYDDSDSDENEEELGLAGRALAYKTEKIINVSNWSAFLSAWNDQTVTKIKLRADITRSGTARIVARTEDIEIDGSKPSPGVGNAKYYRLNLTSTNLPLGKINSGTRTLHVHDILVRNNGDNGAGAANTALFGDARYDPSDSQVVTNKWYLRFGNLIVPYEGNNSGTARLAKIHRGNVSIYGRVTIYTTSENFYLGGIYFEDGADFYGAITYSNYSAIWFRQPSREGDTGTNKFEIGKNAVVKLRNTGNGVTFPAIYRYYKEIIVGENSQFGVTVPGNAIGFGGINQKFSAKKDSVVTLTSRETNASISTNGPTIANGNGNSGSGDTGSARNATFILEPGSSLYSIGRANGSGMIDWSRGSNNRFIIDAPKQYDIRNNNNNIAVNVGGTRNTFEIWDSEVSLWKNATNISAIADHSYDDVGKFSIIDRSTATSTATNLSRNFNANRGNFRRIRGLNTNPSIEIKPITDADKNIYNFFRVKLGEVPDNSGIASDGSISFMPIYAVKNQATVTINDGNESWQITTNDTGYVNYAVPNFYKAGTKITAKAKRSSLESELYELIPVIDVTPPEPARITENKVTTHTKQLIGTGAEANAKIYIDINGVRQPTIGVVNSDGQWTYDLPRYLEAGEVVQIFLEDNAEEVSEPLYPKVPFTNYENGNINPAKEFNYRDAVFKGATKYVVEDTLPNNPKIKKEVVSTGKETTQVGDLLTYTLTVKNDKATSLDTVWRNLVLTDEIPKKLLFDPEKAGITINDQPITKDAYSYDASSRKLVIKLSDLASGESVKIVFKAEVGDSAAGTIIKNTAEVTGNSLREAGPFVSGPHDLDRPLETYSKSDSVNNPGGEIFGTLALTSAPEKIDFGEVVYSGKTVRVNQPKWSKGDLIVNDSRAVRKSWTLTAKLEQEMTHETDERFVLKNAIRYVANFNEQTLNTKDAVKVMVNTSLDVSDYNITNTWSAEGDGIKFEVPASEVKEIGPYQGIILWQLGDTR